MDESGSLKELVQGPEPAGHHNEGARVFHQTHLARKKVTELQALLHVRIGSLLVGQLDIQPDARTARLVRPAVGGLHDSRPAAGQRGKAGPRELRPHLHSQLVVSMRLREASGTEHRHCRPQIVKGFKSAPELRDDALEPLHLALGCSRNHEELILTLILPDVRLGQLVRSKLCVFPMFLPSVLPILKIIQRSF